MPLFDTHCHLDVEAFDPDRREVLTRARHAGVERLLIPAIRRDGWQRLWDLCLEDVGLYPAIGLHPVMLEQHAAEDLDALEAFVRARRPVAIGEIGLDHAIRSLDQSRQLDLLEAQLEIAARQRLPVVLHVRKAHEPMLRSLKAHAPPGGICHAFNGSIQQAERYMDLGFGFGFGGMLTHPNARHLHDLAQAIPLQHIVLETDAPDMSGIEHRHQRNSPEYLPEVVTVLASLRGESAEDIVEATMRNAMRLLRITPQA